MQRSCADVNSPYKRINSLLWEADEWCAFMWWRVHTLSCTKKVCLICKIAIAHIIYVCFRLFFTGIFPLFPLDTGLEFIIEVPVRYPRSWLIPLLTLDTGLEFIIEVPVCYPRSWLIFRNRQNGYRWRQDAVAQGIYHLALGLCYTYCRIFWQNYK